MRDPRLEAIAAKHGVFLTREAKELGYEDKTITQAARSGLWHRVRHGAYVFPEVWHAADAVTRHRIRLRAVLRQTPGPVAASHVSSLVERGVATYGIDLTRVHVTRLDRGAGRIARDVQHHEGLWLHDDVEVVNGLSLIKAPRAVVETLTMCGTEPGLVLTDSAYNKGIATPLDVENTYDRMQFWPGMRSAQLVLRLADGRAESPGESRVRYICWEQGLPKPELQFEVYDEHGNLVGTTDFAWPNRQLLGEFDGKIKYGRLLKPGQDPGEVVFMEKQREDLLREITSWGMVRPVWDWLDDPRAVASRIGRAMRPRAA
ncbi:MAG TPA: type IV toxin-antitoxin system AbiEi family antitoxin domain-containing protein [Nocardioidaceae bacterium]|nr:type IV toxin-antitoxin system AbiEi family antitoxin domain-containing protein [Nocardioidaceae bacterium]